MDDYCTVVRAEAGDRTLANADSVVVESTQLRWPTAIHRSADIRRSAAIPRLNYDGGKQLRRVSIDIPYRLTGMAAASLLENRERHSNSSSAELAMP